MGFRKKHLMKTARLVVLASGAGTLFSAIAAACESKKLSAKVLCLISDKPSAPVVEKALKRNIPAKIFQPKDYSSFEKWDKALYNLLQEYQPDWVALAGFLKKIGPAVLKAYEGRMVNIHPSLLPRHGGKGMYGRYVHEAVIQAGDKTTGAVVHLVSKEYDKGRVLDQIKISVSPKDTADSLEAKVKQKEKEFYVSVLQKLIRGEITV